MKPRRMISWPLWQQRRIVELRAEGLEFDLAQRVGKSETATRQRLSRCIGWRAARAANLNLIADGEEFRFALTGNLTGLSDTQRERLFNLPNVSPMVSPGPIHP